MHFQNSASYFCIKWLMMMRLVHWSLSSVVFFFYCLKVNRICLLWRLQWLLFLQTWLFKQNWILLLHLSVQCLKGQKVWLSTAHTVLYTHLLLQDTWPHPRLLYFVCLCEFPRVRDMSRCHFVHELSGTQSLLLQEGARANPSCPYVEFVCVFLNSCLLYLLQTLCISHWSVLFVQCLYVACKAAASCVWMDLTSCVHPEKDHPCHCLSLSVHYYLDWERRVTFRDPSVWINGLPLTQRLFWEELVCFSSHFTVFIHVAPRCEGVSLRNVMVTKSSWAQIRCWRCFTVWVAALVFLQVGHISNLCQPRWNQTPEKSHLQRG